MSDTNENCTYGYDYENKCDCREDDNCGCTFPNNMPHDFDCRCGDEDENFSCEDNDDADCCECENLICDTLHCQNLIVENLELPAEGNNIHNDENCYCSSVLVRDLAPDFVVPAVMPDNTIVNEFDIDSYLDGSYGLLLFYPADFTFVCPSELIAFNRRLNEFENAASNCWVSVSIRPMRTSPGKNGAAGRRRRPAGLSAGLRPQ